MMHRYNDTSVLPASAPCERVTLSSNFSQSKGQGVLAWLGKQQKQIAEVFGSQA
jgi:hypothetical protein